MRNAKNHSNARLLACAAATALLAGGMTGCQSGSRQADGFGGGADRPPTPRTLHMMAKLINENGRFDQAEFVLSRVISDTPEYLPAYVELADLYIEQGRFGDAIATLQNAHTIAPNDPVLANNLGVLLLRESEFKAASSAFMAAVAEDPAEARYHANLAVSFAMQGEYHQAYSAWAAVLPPEEVFWNIGVVAEARGDSRIASEHFANANDIRKGVVAEAEGTAVASEFDSTIYGPLPEPNAEATATTTATVSVPVD